MKNYQIDGVDGKKYWVHRNIAVAGFIFRYYKGNLQVLINQRGSGVSNHQGLWNCPCGFLDYGETLKEACIREIEEECKLIININKLKLAEVQDNPNAYMQNVTHRFYALLKTEDNTTNISIGTGGEKNEVSDVKWINISDVDKYNWAFNHDEIIMHICKLDKKVFSKLSQLYYKFKYYIIK